MSHLPIKNMKSWLKKAGNQLTNIGNKSICLLNRIHDMKSGVDKFRFKIVKVMFQMNQTD